jgi:hypothetical protein
VGADDALDVAEGVMCIEHVWRTVEIAVDMKGSTIEETCPRCGESRLVRPFR